MAKTIQVSTGVDIYIDDLKLRPKDANGNPVEVFVYNGTTYLPARAVSEAVGKPIQWDGKTSGVYIGKHDSDTPAVMLQDLDYYTASGMMSTKATEKDNLGNTYTDVIYGVDGEFDRTYRINGQYRRIRGIMFRNYEYRSSTYTESILKIYGDSRLLYTGIVKGGEDPVNFDVDISGVLELRFEWKGGAVGWGDWHVSSLANVGLYT